MKTLTKTADDCIAALLDELRFVKHTYQQVLCGNNLYYPKSDLDDRRDKTAHAWEAYQQRKQQNQLNGDEP